MLPTVPSDEAELDESSSGTRVFGEGFDDVSDDESHFGADSSGGLEASTGGFEGPQAPSIKSDRRNNPRMRKVYHIAA
jgi:hypothetical protein